VSSTDPLRPLSFVGALTLLFIALKLTGHIDWSWWWVLSPQLIVGGLRFLAALGEANK
jgi:hypothetical protein